MRLKQADDENIWKWAKANDFAVVTTDGDFVALAQRFGYPPKVVHLEQCDFPLRVIEDLLRRSAVRIAEFQRDARSGLLRSLPNRLRLSVAATHRSRTGQSLAWNSPSGRASGIRALNVDWEPAARADLRRLDRDTAMRILLALTRYGYLGEGDVKRLTESGRAVPAPSR